MMHNYVNIDVAENVAYAYWKTALDNEWLVDNGHAPKAEIVQLFRELRQALKVKASELRTVTDNLRDSKDFDEFYQKLMALKAEEMQE